MEEYQTKEKMDWKKYVVVLVITALLFATAFYLSDYFNNKKINSLKDIQDTISIDILSSETQFSLLEEMSCKDVNTSILSDELNSLGEKIEYSEKNISNSNQEIFDLKRYYSLLEIKDYILMKKVSERCGTKTAFILYFYSTKDSCGESCTQQGDVLTALREKYPKLRVYSFDYNLDLTAIQALISIYRVPQTLPALVIDGVSYNGFKSIEDIEKLVPNIKKLVATPPATTSQTKVKADTQTPPASEGVNVQ